MNIDSTTLSLFNNFPREVSLGRMLVTSLRNFENYIRVNNRINGCYTSLFSNDIIDKVVFDYDYGKSLLVSKIAYQQWINCGIPVIPDGTGRKGLHHFIPFFPMNSKYSTKRKKELLAKAGFGLLKMVFRKFPKEVDSSVIGDLRQIIRIPNTARPPNNQFYCTYLPVEYERLTEKQFKEHMQTTHVYNYKLPRLLHFEEFDYIDLEKVYPDRPKIIGNSNKFYQGMEEGGIAASPEIQETLQPFLRDCIFNRIIRYNPSNDIRVIAGIDLLQLFDLQTVFTIFKKIGWHDWNPDITMDKLTRLQKYKPYSDKTLRKMQIMELDE